MSAKTETPASTHQPTSPVLTNDMRQRPLRLRLYPDEALRGVAKHVDECDHHVDALCMRTAGRHNHHPRPLESERAA